MRRAVWLLILAGCVRPTAADLPRELLRIDGTDEVLCVAFSPDDTWVAVGARDSSIRVCSLMTGAVVHTLDKHRSWVTSLAFSPDGSLLASGGADQANYVWVTDSWRAVRRLEPAGDKTYSTPAVFSPDGSILVWGSGQTIHLRDPRTGEAIGTIRADEHNLTGIDFSPNGKMIASADGYANVHLWEAFTGNERPLPAEVRGSSVAFAPAGEVLAAWGMEHGIILADVRSGRRAWRINKSVMVACAAISPDGDRIAAGHADGRLAILDLHTGAEILVYQAHRSGVNCVAWSADGRRLATGGRDGVVTVWQVAD